MGPDMEIGMVNKNIEVEVEMEMDMEAKIEVEIQAEGGNVASIGTAVNAIRGEMGGVANNLEGKVAENQQGVEQLRRDMLQWGRR